jgi:hypothetical protein
MSVQSTRILPKLEYTRLPNGLRVVSFDRHGEIANLGKQDNASFKM